MDLSVHTFMCHSRFIEMVMCNQDNLPPHSSPAVQELVFISQVTGYTFPYVSASATGDTSVHSECLLQQQQEA